MFPIESEGRSVAEAVDAALKTHGLRRDQVEVSVLQDASGGFLGMGVKPAKVRLTEKRWGSSTSTDKPLPKALPRPAGRRPDARPERAPAPAESPRPAAPRAPRDERPAPKAPKPMSGAETTEACRKAQELVTELLRLMGVAAPTVSSAWDGDLERVKLVVESQDAHLLVGRDGRVLESLQLLSSLMLSRGGEPLAVQVDALSFWEKKEQTVLDEARKAAESVRATGKPWRLEPMDASMRRLVHRSFASDKAVVTASEGEGAWRKIVIRPRTG